MSSTSDIQSFTTPARRFPGSVRGMNSTKRTECEGQQACTEAKTPQLRATSIQRRCDRHGTTWFIFMRLSLSSSHLKTRTAWFKNFPRHGTSQEAFRSGNVPVTLCSALPNFHHTWLSFQTHVALRRFSQQVGSDFAHQHPHHDVRACDRGHQPFRDHQGLLHLTQTELFVIEVLLAEATAVSVWPPLGMEVSGIEFYTAAPAVRQSSPRIVPPILGGETYLFCSPTVSGTSTGFAVVRRWSTGPSCRSLSNRPFRLLEGLLDIHALSPWSWRAPSTGMCVSSSISVSVEDNDR